MKKVFILLTLLTIFVFVGGNAFAVDPISTKTAKVNFGAAPAVTINVDLYDFVANKDWDTYSTTVDEISFTTTTVTLGNVTPQWAVGKTFAKLSGNLMAQPDTTKIYMYTRNKTAGTYQAITPRNNDGVNVYNGLVRKGHTATLKNGDYAGLKIICKRKSEASNATYPTDFTASFGSGMRYVLDKDDANFNTLKANNDCYSVIAKGGNGYGLFGFWIGCNDSPGADWANWWTGTNSGTDDIIMFFAAQFDHVTGGSEYGTTTITFSTETE